ncbi:methyltransferase [Nocardioides sp. YIM 152588]|uniref:class I SAM-dependent methyltransferase n=1 Tax=Nocardioides sp. YIM 152588 TaxID=3158259 RepID=UPI0032E3C99F
MGADPWLAGDRYEPYVGRWSRLVAPRFLAWLAAPAGLRWIDVGCGTGALTAAVAEHTEPASVLGVDPSPGFVTWAAEHHAAPGVAYRVGYADGLEPGGADVVVSGLVLNFLPDPDAALAAMAAAAPGGTVAAYVWDYAGGMELLRLFWDAAVAADPTAAPLHEARRFPGWGAEDLAARWRAAGLAEVETTEVDVEATYPGPLAVWVPFLGGTGPAPGYVASLADPQRDALRDRFLAGLPVGADGRVRLTARAHAVRGRA